MNRGTVARQDGLSIGIDVGGTKVAAGVVTADGTIAHRVRRDSPARMPRRSS